MNETASCFLHGDSATRVYEAVIKVALSDPPERRARDISEGISYACSLLMDEYGWTADRIADSLTAARDETYDLETQC